MRTEAGPDSYTKMRAELAAKVKRWHEVRPTLMADSRQLNVITFQINLRFGTMWRLIDLAEGHSRSGRRFLAALSLLRAVRARKRVNRFVRRIEAMLP